MVDNHDSFTYNLVHAFEMLGVLVKVVGNNEITVQECKDLQPKWIVISPGPGNPSEAGFSRELIASIKEIPILGVCLGHQAIAEVFGGKVVKAKRPLHGFLSEISHNGEGLFKEIPNPFRVVRYHSLIVDENIPSCLQVTARSQNGEVMGIRHKQLNIEGVQFHPEALLTEYGMTLLNNFLNRKDHNYVKESLFYIDRSHLPSTLIR